MNAVSNRFVGQIRNELIQIGYPKEAIVENYGFIGLTGVQQANLVAFGDIHRHDLSTSCIAVYWCANGKNRKAILEQVRFLAPPLAFITTPEKLEIWPVSKEISDTPHEELDYDHVNEYFSKNRLSLMPNTLLAAKHRERQLTFFDIDPELFPYAYEATQNILVRHFEQAVSVGQSKLRRKRKKGKSYSPKDLIPVAMRLLAARILEDKLWVDEPRARTASDLLNKAHHHFENYFAGNEIDSVGEEVAQLIFEELRGDLTFRSLTNEMLSYFYEHAFVTPQIRKQLGIYYTPSEIARNILNRLPIEDIPPEERFVFDGSCGSGGLLGMAYERLESLLPVHQDNSEKYRYLTEHIWGLDTDGLASETARLSLLLRSLPFGDNWNIKTGNFVEIDRSILPEQISIIVGNPPFSEPRAIDKKRQEKAALFLEGYLDLLAPGGLMGIILPESFLKKSSCEQARRRLLSECELLEVWQLPGGVIPLSGAPIAVLLLRKNELSKNSVVRIQRVLNRNEDEKRFLEEAKATYSYILPSQKQWAHALGNEMIASPFDKLWERLQNQLKLSDIATVRNGITIGKKGYNNLFFYKAFTHKSLRNPPKDLKLWLHGSSAIDPYFIDCQSQEYNYVNYPGNLYRPQLDMKSVFEGSKVFVNARQRNSPWWLYAVIDESGYFPNKELHYIFNPANHISLEEIAAVLNSPVANAWIDSVNTLYVETDTLRAMPFPKFSDEQRQQVIERVREILNLKQSLFSAVYSTTDDIEERIRKLIIELDDIIFFAYGLSEEEQRQILDLFRGFPRPGREWKKVPFSPDIAEPTLTTGRHWRVTGHVIDIDGKKGMICVWIRGFGNGEPAWIPIPREMPGWALRPDAAFEADIPYEDRYQQELKNMALMNFTPLEFGYLSDEGLFDHIAQRMQTFEEIGNSNDFFFYN